MSGLATPAAVLQPASVRATGSQDALKIRARKAAEDFEAVFLNTFVEQMFSGLKTDGPFGGGQSEAIYRSYLSQEYASELARSGGVGLADQVYSEILKMQEAAGK